MTVEKYLRNLFWGTVAVPLLIATVYECDVLPTGVFAGKALLQRKKENDPTNNYDHSDDSSCPSPV